MINKLYKNIFKRLFDILLSLTLLIVLSPILVIVSILIRFKLGSPILFKQLRPGLNNETFLMYKFRTMTDKTDNKGQLLPDKDRITKFGQILRSTSLDELPELLNILKGDMSFVGPRPLLVDYLTLYNNHQIKRHEVRPGLTGLAQINGRNNISWNEKFDLDVDYVENISFFTDFSIFFKTILYVLKRSDVNEDGHVTTSPFLGNDYE